MADATLIVSSVVMGALALGSAAENAGSIGVALQTATTQPATAIQLIVPIDLVELTKAVLSGLTALAGALAAGYAIVGAARAKRAETAGVKAVTIAEATSLQIDGLLAERDRAKVKEGHVLGAAAGERVAEALAEGQRQGAEIERASVAAANPAAALPVAATGLAAGVAPVPVTDEASSRMADALEKTADATVKTLENTPKADN